MSTEFSMFQSLPSSYMPELRRQMWGRLFGKGIQECRERVGLSVEDAASLSGMEVSEWAAIEEGFVPQSINQLHAMADAMAINFERLANLVLLCQDAWEL